MLIKQIARNPENLFSLSMARLKRQRTEWREVIKPVLGVLLVAREPLKVRHIRQIIRVEDDQLRDGLELLGGLIVKDWQQRYSLFHLKLYDYLRQDQQRLDKEYIFATDEEEGWHNKLAQWCEQGDLQTIWQDEQDVVEQQRREYARRHYVAHLYHAHEWLQLFRVLDNIHYGQAKVRYDPSTRSYAQDVDLGWQAAAWEGWSVEKRIELLPRLWQYTLLRCSLTSQADQYPELAFQFLILLGRNQEALGLAELLTNSVSKVRALLQIIKQIQGKTGTELEWLEILLRASEVALTIEDIEARAQTLLELGITLAQVQQWERADETIRSITSKNVRAKALSELGIVLAQAQQWERATSVTQTIMDIKVRTEALGELVTALARAQQWEHVEKVIHSISDSEARARVLVEIGIVLTQIQQWERTEKVLSEAEEQTYNISDSEARARVLGEIGIALAQIQQWEHAEKVIQMISSKYVQARVLRNLSRLLVQAQQWKRAESVAYLMEDSHIRIRALHELAVSMNIAGEREHLLSLIRNSWWHTSTRENVLKLFPLATEFISHKPEIGFLFFKAFIWVDTFLHQ